MDTPTPEPAPEKPEKISEDVKRQASKYEIARAKIPGMDLSPAKRVVLRKNAYKLRLLKMGEESSS